MTLPETNATLRTDAAFKAMSDEDHHRGPNPFCELSIGILSQSPIDYMHLLCLGVMKRLILLWISGPLKVRIEGKVQQNISDFLLILRKSIPMEFARKSRAIADVSRWKATEFRQFLLYTGPLVLCVKIADELYKNFLLLSIGIRILTDPHQCMTMCEFAQKLLTAFVNHYSQLFGSNSVVYNIHGLVHLANDVKTFGPLDKFSSFPYENYLNRLKHLVRKPNHVLQQIVSRLNEKSRIQVNVNKIQKIGSFPNLKRPHILGSLSFKYESCEQFGKVVLQKFTITLAMPDNCTKAGNDIGITINILHKFSQVFIVYQKFCTVEPFFLYPCNSLDLNICKVSKVSVETFVCPINQIENKMVLFPIKADLYVALPLIHTL